MVSLGSVFSLTSDHYVNLRWSDVCLMLSTVCVCFTCQAFIYLRPWVLGNLRPWETKITLFYVPAPAVGKATRQPAPAPELSTGYPQALGAYIARVQGTSVDISQHQALSYPQPHHSPPWTRLKCTEVRLSTKGSISYTHVTHSLLKVTYRQHWSA